MAVDPLTAKILAKVAMQAATDSESRKRILFMILAPVLGLLLLIAFILYLITSPFSVLSQWLIGDEVNVVEDFQKQYGYNQQLGIYEKDYIDGRVDPVNRLYYDAQKFPPQITAFKMHQFMFQNHLYIRWRKSVSRYCNDRLEKTNHHRTLYIWRYSENWYLPDSIFACTVICDSL